MNSDRNSDSICPGCGAKPGPVADGVLRMAPLLGLPRLLENHGLDADAEIRRTGLAPALFRDPENTIEFSAVGRLLEHAAAATGHPYPGLELGRHLGLDVLGVVGRVARLAPDIGSALHNLIADFQLHDRGAIPSLWEGKQQTTLGYTVYCPEVPGINHIYDCALAVTYNVLTDLAGKGWRPTEVRMCRSKPKDISPFRRLFSSPMKFASERVAVSFPTTDLARPLPGADRNAYARGLRELEVLRTSSGDTLANRVLRLLRQILVSGGGPDGLDRHKVAQILRLHPRTLNRRLRAEGTAFNELLAQARYEIARQMLRDTSMSTSHVALSLGYAGTASFDHAFRRWSGTTATAWRSSQDRS